MKKLSILTGIALVLSATVMFVFKTDIAPAVAGSTAFVAGVEICDSLQLFSVPTFGLYQYIGAPGTERGVQVISSERARGAYMTYKNRPENANKTIFNSYLRLESTIIDNQSRISFKTFVGDAATTNPSEKRLDRNDKFGITSWGFFLLKQPDGKSNSPWYTYPNLTAFAAGAASDLESIYNGALSITVNNNKVVSSYAMNNFLIVPETQQSAATNRDQRSLHKNLVPLTPHLDLDGSANNEIEIQFPTHAAWAGGTAPAGFKHVAMLFFNGFLITGGSANT